MAEQTRAVETGAVRSANTLTVAATYVDPITKALYVHKDLEQVLPDWAIEQHLPPIARTEHFGDVESWASYVRRFGQAAAHENDEGAFDLPFLTWSERGLTAILDYHAADGTADRCQWLAEHRFERSHQWQRWAQLANGKARTQREVLEALEDYAEDIREPAPAQLIGILRMLRATAGATAESELAPDGSTHIVYAKSNAVKAGELDLPSEFQVQIQVLRGHVEPTSDGKTTPVLYRLPVRVRVSVDDSAHLAIRLSMPTAERTLEAVLADQVQAAERLLGAGYELLRAAA